MTTALAHGLFSCDACHLLNHVDPDDLTCARCGSRLEPRKPESYQRAWAYLAAAGVLYIPANLLPVLHTGSIFGRQTDTIMSGVVHLWHTGSPVLAIIVFIASIVVPAAKIVSLAFLLTLARRRSTWNPLARARLYRATHQIGRWSMVDIFVGATLVALVHLGPFANIEPGPAAIAFGAVVILTMLASMSFDPRLTWDAVAPAR
jgi:paraquat-inducible protein A